MTLEDFFTLTEMKDGLTIPARVEELIAAMKKEKDFVVKNVGDAVRQWSTVSSVIAVTQNKDCLDHFIHSDGLLFIDRWLKDAQAIAAADSSDCFIEESISALLQALEKVKIDNDKLSSSGICLSLTNLLNHKSNSIQDKAKALLGNLKPPTVSGAVKLESEEAQTVCADRTELGNMLPGETDTRISSSSISPDQKSVLDTHVRQLVGDNAVSSGSCANQQSDGVEAVVKEPDKLASHCSESDPNEVKDKVESYVREEECSSERKSTSASPNREQGTVVWREVTKLGYVTELVNAEVHEESLPNNLGKVKIYPASILLKPVEASSSLAKIHVLTDGKAGSGSDNNLDSSTMKNISDELSMGGPCIGAEVTGALMHNTISTDTLVQKTPSLGDESCSKNSQDSTVGESIVGKLPELSTTYPETDKANFIDEVVVRAKHDRSHLRDSGGFESSRGSRSIDVASKTSVMDLEYGTVDALEVACLVAKEVERQVVDDCKKQFGSFSEKSSGDGTLHLAGSPASFNGKRDQYADGTPLHESPIVEKMVEDSHRDDEFSKNATNVDADEENSMKVIEPSQVTDKAPDAANNAGKGTPVIDLNLEMCSEATGNSVSYPVAVVSASRAVAVPGLLASPLKVEGALGWKGSAATSAFRPASPRKTSDGKRTILVEEATNATRQGHDFLIDLNFAEDGGDEITDTVSCNKQNLCLPCAPSGESLVQPSPRRSEKLSFDLNQMSEDTDAPFSPSHASSLSSLKPAMRNFDLNDRPSTLSDLSGLPPYLGTLSSHQPITYGRPSGASVISIMGAKVNNSTSVHQAPISFLNGWRASETVANSNLARLGPSLAAGSGSIQYTPPPAYSYNGVTVGPTMPFSPLLYGPGGSAYAYMFDSNGASIVPQLIGTPQSALQAPFSHQSAFTANMVGPPPGQNGASSSRPHFDFNLGFVTEGANRVDAGDFRQLFPGQGRSVEMQLQSLFLGIVGGKRKEPDGGWERHQQPHL